MVPYRWYTDTSKLVHATSDDIAEYYHIDCHSSIAIDGDTV